MSVVDEARMRGMGRRVRAMILHPRSEWEAIAREPATVRGLFTGYVMYLAAIGPVCATLSSLVFGWSGAAHDLHPGVFGSIVSGILSYALGVAAIYGMGLLIAAVAPIFDGERDRIAAMKVAAYFPTAAWLAGIFLLFPPLGALGLLGLYSLFILWLGLPRLMKVPPHKALVFTLVMIVAAMAVELLVSTVVGAAVVSMLPAPGGAI